MKKSNYKVVIDLTNASSHRANIQIQATSGSLPILKFPVWTPGSYMVREYSRHVTRLDPAEKIEKNIWRPLDAKKVSYEVYLFEKTVRTSYVDQNYAALIGPTLLPLLGDSYTVEIRFPKNWKLFSTAIPHKKVGPGRWLLNVTNDDQWIDSPIVAAAPGFGELATFKANGIDHHIAWVGQSYERSMDEMKKAFKKICEVTHGMFGSAPFKEYWFLFHFGHKLYGGLEHRDSQLSQFDGASMIENKNWDGFLRLVAHEYFHSWNVKSLRPVALGPFDYSKENYTEDLWFAEGLTDYFDDIIPLEAGLITPATYWKSRLKDAQTLSDGLPGQKRRSLAECSFDAWIRYYRGDEDSINTDITYYAKGALLGWCWDAHLRQKSKGKWTLKKLMRAFYEEFGIDAYVDLASAKPGYTRAQLFAFAEKITKIQQGQVIESWITDRKPLPWRQAAQVFKVKIQETISDSFFAHTGISIQFKPGAFAAKVLSESPAESAGIAANDEIIAINNYRVTDNEKLQQLWKTFEKSKTLKITYCRQDKIFETQVSPKLLSGVGVEIAGVQEKGGYPV